MCVAWIAAFVSVTIISLCGLVGIGMVPLTKFSAYHEILRFMIAIAIGTLCGDALMVKNIFVEKKLIMIDKFDILLVFFCVALASTCSSSTS